MVIPKATLGRWAPPRYTAQVTLLYDDCLIPSIYPGFENLPTTTLREALDLVSKLYPDMSALVSAGVALVSLINDKNLHGTICGTLRFSLKKIGNASTRLR